MLKPRNLRYYFKSLHYSSYQQCDVSASFSCLHRRFQLKQTRLFAFFCSLSSQVSWDFAFVMSSFLADFEEKKNNFPSIRLDLIRFSGRIAWVCSVWVSKNAFKAPTQTLNPSESYTISDKERKSFSHPSRRLRDAEIPLTESYYESNSLWVKNFCWHKRFRALNRLNELRVNENTKQIKLKIKLPENPNDEKGEIELERLIEWKSIRSWFLVCFKIFSCLCSLKRGKRWAELYLELFRISGRRLFVLRRNVCFIDWRTNLMQCDQVSTNARAFCLSILS